MCGSANSVTAKREPPLTRTDDPDVGSFQADGTDRGEIIKYRNDKYVRGKKISLDFSTSHGTGLKKQFKIFGVVVVVGESISYLSIYFWKKKKNKKNKKNKKKKT